MRRIISLTLVLSLLSLFVLPLCCAAAGENEATTDSPSKYNKGFNFELATTLIVIICSLLLAATLIAVVILAKRNIHN